jgi:RNA polymerase sigma-70 factor (ECF subfamily)
MSREQQFRDVLKENSRRVYRICSYFFTDSGDCDDAYQESLIRIWENLPSFRGKSKLSTWIYRVAVNTCLAHIRSDKRRISLIEKGCSYDNLQVAELPAEDDPEATERKAAFLKRFLDSLNAADRTLVSLYIEDLPTREISEITGLSEANVRVRLHRIKEKIKNEWEEIQHGT